MTTTVFKGLEILKSKSPFNDKEVNSPSLFNSKESDSRTTRCTLRKVEIY